MKRKIKFDVRILGLTWFTLLSLSTIAIFIFVGSKEFTNGGLVIAWLFFSWNFFAYAFDKRMWPPQFVELHGDGKGLPAWRSFWFWFSVLVYAALLLTIVLAE